MNVQRQTLLLFYYLVALKRAIVFINKSQVFKYFFNDYNYNLCT
jgi:hypothetical protein